MNWDWKEIKDKCPKAHKLMCNYFQIPEHTDLSEFSIRSLYDFFDTIGNTNINLFTGLDSFKTGGEEIKRIFYYAELIDNSGNHEPINEKPLHLTPFTTRIEAEAAAFSKAFVRMEKSIESKKIDEFEFLKKSQDDIQLSISNINAVTNRFQIQEELKKTGITSDFYVKKIVAYVQDLQNTSCPIYLNGKSYCFIGYNRGSMEHIFDFPVNGILELNKCNEIVLMPNSSIYLAFIRN